MDRIDFGERIFSTIIPEGTPVEEIKRSMFPISEALFRMMPESLFRYRPCTPNAVDAFKNDTIYTLTADKFNDPYDTLARYDLNEMERVVRATMSIEALIQLKAWLAQGNDFPNVMRQYISQEKLSALKENLLSIEDLYAMEDHMAGCTDLVISLMKTYFPIISQVIKRFSTVACFSESVQSILMWSHYAKDHTGFALEYNFRPTLSQPIKDVLIAPVIYQDQRVDISSCIGWAFLAIMGEKTKNPDIMASIKNALCKSTEWAYEKEWRLINYASRDYRDESAAAIPYRPVAMYFGQSMPHEHKTELHAIATEKGIKEFEMYVDYSSPKFEMLYRPYVAIHQ